MIVSEKELVNTLRDLRNGSEDLALTRLRCLVASVFTGACGDLKDIVVGRMVNGGADADAAREAATAITEYERRMARE